MLEESIRMELKNKDGKPILLKLPTEARELLQQKANAAGKNAAQYARCLVLDAIFFKKNKENSKKREEFIEFTKEWHRETMT